MLVVVVVVWKLVVGVVEAKMVLIAELNLRNFGIGQTEQLTGSLQIVFAG